MPDQTNPPINALFGIVVAWAREQGMPPRSFWEGQTDDWTVRVNGTPEMLEGIDPFHIHLEHRFYLACAVVGPTGGEIIGPTEDEVITHFNGLLKEPLEAVA